MFFSNEDYARLAAMRPVESVDELIDRVEAAQMPIYDMRFFINEDRKEPKCFGVYYDETRALWVVYKNKANGMRAIRLETRDEGRAAQEIWEKILSEIKLRLDKENETYGAPYTPDSAPADTAGSAEDYEKRLEEEALRQKDDATCVTVDEVIARMKAHRVRPVTGFKMGGDIIGAFSPNGQWVVYRNDAEGKTKRVYSGDDEREAARTLEAWAMARVKCGSPSVKRSDTGAYRSAGHARPQRYGQRASSSSSGIGCFVLIVALIIFGMISTLLPESKRSGSYHSSSYSDHDSRWYDDDDDDDDDWDSGWDSDDTDWDSDW